MLVPQIPSTSAHPQHSMISKYSQWEKCSSRSPLQYRCLSLSLTLFISSTYSHSVLTLPIAVRLICCSSNCHFTDTHHSTNGVSFHTHRTSHSSFPTLNTYSNTHNYKYVSLPLLYNTLVSHSFHSHLLFHSPIPPLSSYHSTPLHTPPTPCCHTHCSHNHNHNRHVTNSNGVVCHKLPSSSCHHSHPHSSYFIYIPHFLLFNSIQFNYTQLLCSAMLCDCS